MYKADAQHPNATLAAKLAHLYTLRGGPMIDLTIRPAYLELLRRLGDPHKKLPPVIHVAGTNGKGSTIATMRSILQQAGLTTHVYTSPHLLRFNERIVLAGAEIADEALEALLDEVTAANDTLPLTFFEITTAMAFLGFSRIKADFVLLETGLGGRLDCTNVIENPAVTIITAIGIDHAEFLGDTVEKIAREKAGIMKRGSPCVIAPQTEARVLPVFEARAEELPCALHVHGRDWRCEAREGAMMFDDIALPLPALTGPHQVGNAGTAIAALRLLGRPENTTEIMAEGLRKTRWPARLQQLERTGPFMRLPSEWEIWLDGGHNENAAQALARQLSVWHQMDGKPLHILTTMMKTKDPAAFFKPIAPFAASIIALRFAEEDLAHDPATLTRAVSQAGVTLATAESLEKALSLPAFEAQNGRLLITGSLYLAGYVLGQALRKN